VDEYIASVPAPQRDLLTWLRAEMKSALKDATEEIGSAGFPVYARDGTWLVGFATRSKGAMLYIMVHEVLARHEKALGKRITGKSCVELRETDDLPISRLKALVLKMIREVAEAEKAR